MNRDTFITFILIVLVLLAATTTILFGRPLTNTDTVVLLQTRNMTCGSCSQQISQALSKQPGIATVGVDVSAGIVEVQFDSRKATPVSIANAVSNLGFASIVAYVQPIKNSPQPQSGTPGCAKGGCGNCNKK
jgi:copper chaperone CopZ